jgi:hypothetical protein
MRPGHAKVPQNEKEKQELGISTNNDASTIGKDEKTYTGADIEWRTQTRKSVLRKLAANCTRL